MIETFALGAKPLVYERLHGQRRMFPLGLHYVKCWLEQNGDSCFQLLEIDSPQSFEQRKSAWDDLISLEIIELESQVPVPYDAA